MVGGFLASLAKSVPPAPPQANTNQQVINFATGQLLTGASSVNTTETRDRQQIYFKLQRMAKFAPIAEAIKIHVTTALGGDSYTNKTIFLKPASRLRVSEDELSKLDKIELEKVNKRIGRMENLLNRNIFKVCHDAVVYGDAYVRLYGKKSIGLQDIICDHRTQAPLVLAFEQGRTPVGYLFANGNQNAQQEAITLNGFQVKRLRIQPIIETNQQDIIDNINYAETLLEDDIDKLAVLPAKIGGSFLIEVEQFYDNVLICLSALTTQQIADSVKRMTLSLNQEAMSPAQRQQYTQFLKGLIEESEEYTKNALQNGEALYNTQYMMLPQMGEKQAVNFLGDTSGQRVPVNTETFMINVRLLMGGLGLDPAFVGWSDLLTGGLGDGGALRTSVQSMLRAQRIRQDAFEYINSVMATDWLYAYGEEYKDVLDYAWEIEFYSDQTASMTEQLANQTQRVQTSMGMLQVFEQAKALGMSKEYMIVFFERRLGLDYKEAEEAVNSLMSAKPQEETGGFNE